MHPIRLVTVAPGHFHAALVQKHATPGVDRRVHVYAPLDADLVAHLGRVAAFNARADNPTAWELDVRAGGDWRERFRRERAGNVVVLSGRNRPKVGLIRDAVAAGYHVLADKPWVVDAAHLPELDAALAEADRRGLLVWDVMTERHEVTNRLLRAITREPDVFGDWLPGSPEEPGLSLTSAHFLLKTVAGRPLLRPWWWFDPDIAGEGMADVGTHLIDLALWLVAPDEPVEVGRDADLGGGDRWRLAVSRERFTRVTGLPDVPAELARYADEKAVYYWGNHAAWVRVRGVHVRLCTRWDYHEPGGDNHATVARGTSATVTVARPSAASPEVSEREEPHEVTVRAAGSPAGLYARLRAGCDRWQAEFPGLAVERRGEEARLVIPPRLRTGHEEHFAAVLREFVRAYHDPAAVPGWVRVNARTKYHLTTRAAGQAREGRPF